MPDLAVKEVNIFKSMNGFFGEIKNIISLVRGNSWFSFFSWKLIPVVTYQVFWDSIHKTGSLSALLAKKTKVTLWVTCGPFDMSYIEDTESLDWLVGTFGIGFIKIDAVNLFVCTVRSHHGKAFSSMQNWWQHSFVWHCCKHDFTMNVISPSLTKAIVY